MSAQFVRFEHTGVATIGHVVPSKVTEREAGVIQEEINAAGPDAGWRFAINLEAVSLLASAGLGTLLTTNTACKSGGGRLVVYGLGEDILGMMKIARLDKVLTITPDRDAALKLFQ
ncbi:MAG: STAS domain-containing protein [Planctomycetota bacterium]|nr:MAG: STAS domain-containing protein [Planctomycetota bacterium]